MKRQSSILIIIAALVMAAFVMGSVQKADALFVLTLDDLDTGGVDVIVVDNTDGGVGTTTAKGPSTDDDISALDGVITYTGSVGNFFVNVSTSISKPAIVSPHPASLHLNNVSVSSVGGGQLLVEATDTDWSIPFIATPGLMSNLSVTQTAGATLDAHQILDLGNKEFAIGSAGPTYTLTHTQATTLTFSETKSMGVTLTNPFSLTDSALVYHPATGGTTSFDVQSDIVPEPGTLLLLGFGLIGLAGYGWRRKRKQS